MKNQDFMTTLMVDAAPSRVFNAVNNVRGWWSENIDGETDKAGAEFLYHYQDVHRASMKITELVPNEKVVWHVLDNYFKFTKDETEWKDTRVIFEISGADGKTRLDFTHQGLVPEYECFKVCQDAWTHYIQDSLKELILKGQGRPTPRDAAEESSRTKPAEKQAPITPAVSARLAASGEPAVSGEPVVPAEPAALKSIFHSLLIEAPVEKVYEALTTQRGLAGWWTTETKAEPAAGTISRFSFGPDYFKEMKIEELRPYNKVKWLCLKGFEEWIGTTVTFELEPHKRGCSLLFHHDRWKEYTREFAGCSFDWALFLRSLKFLCETGKGFPYPDFRK